MERRIKTFNELFEDAGDESSWMPPYERIVQIPRYKFLADAGVLTAGGGTPRQIKGGYREFNSGVAGPRSYPYVIRPNGVVHGTPRVSLKYGSTVVERYLKFSNVDEMNHVIDTILVYCASMNAFSRYDKLKKLVNGGDIKEIVDLVQKRLFDSVYSTNTELYAIGSELIKLTLNNSTIKSKYKSKYNVIESIIKLEELDVPEASILASSLLLTLSDDDIDKHMKSTPTDMYLLDAYPHRKLEVLKRTGLKDLSKLGRSIKSGMI